LSGSDTEKMQETVRKIEKSLSYIEDEKVLAICQVLIDKDKLSEDLRTLVESNVNGEFWQMQDLEEVQNAVSSFL